MNRVECCKAAQLLSSIDSDSVSLIWTDPPFGTRKVQELESTWGPNGKQRYMDGNVQQTMSLSVELAREAERVLKQDGVLALLLDYRSIHESVAAIKLETGLVFGGEVIWHFELGGVSRKFWTNKHNTIALFHRGSPKFHLDRVPTVERKVKRDGYVSDQRRVNSVWSITMGPMNRERTGYPNQKPVAIVDPFIQVHTDVGDVVVDPYCGSGVVAAAAKAADRYYVVGDSSEEAIRITNERLREM